MIWLRNFLEFDKEAPPFWQNWLIVMPFCAALVIVFTIPAAFYVLGRQVSLMRGAE